MEINTYYPVQNQADLQVLSPEPEGEFYYPVHTAKPSQISIIGPDSVLSFDCLSPSIVMFIINYIGRINLDALYPFIATAPWAQNMHDELPVGPNGSVVSKGYKNDRQGALRKGRSEKVFRNSIGMDMSADGFNVNFKIAGRGKIQVSGAKSVQHGISANHFLLEYLNSLACFKLDPLEFDEMRIERFNYNFRLGYQVNLTLLSEMIDTYNMFHVVYNNTLNEPLRLTRISRFSDAIIKNRSKLSKRSKIPSITLLIRKSGKVMIGGPVDIEVEEIYYLFHQLLFELNEKGYNFSICPDLV